MNKISLILLCTAFGYCTANAQTGNIGVGNNTPVAKLDVAGDLALREGTAIAVSGASPSVTVTLTATAPENSFYRITGAPTGTMTLNSIANAVDGQIITLVNATSIKLKISNTNSAGGILTSGGAATIIAPNGSVTLQYSSSAARWFVTNAAGATITDWIKATTTDETAISTDNQYVSGNVGLGGHTGGAGDNTYNFANNTPAVPLVVVSPGTATAASSPTTTGIRLAQPGTNGTKWPVSADFKLGSYATSGANAQSQLDIALGNGGNNVPDATVMSILGNGRVGIGTSSPIATLHAVAPAATTAFAGRFTQTNTTNGNNTFIGLSTENNSWSKAAIGFQRTGSYDIGDITFNLNSTNTSGTDVSSSDERIRIKNNGDLQMTGSQGKLWLETNGWSDPGATGAGIAVDNNTYKTLMIVGNKVAGNKGQDREVQVWDYLKVNGYVTVGTETDATATAPPSGTIRYNTTRKCMEYYDGTYWICMGPPTVQKVTVRDIIDGNYTGTGCNACSGWAGSYGGTYNFTINNLYAGQKIMFYVEVFLDNDTHKNGAYANAMKLYGNGYWSEDESPSPGWEASITKVFPAQQINATGNLGFTFESNQGFTDLRITAVAY
ncbi:MAG: hypothetical protein U0T77_13055 [Chitinophagales bacterium]